jgi:protein-disulfide isomerase
VSKQFLAIIAIVVVLLGGVFIFSSKDSSNKSSSSNAGPTNHVEGSASSGVKLVEYGDYECPFCGQYYPLVKQVAEQYKGKIQFQFRNLPLTQIHKNAFASARAAEAASLQGKFWQMHDALYENQDPNGASGWVASSDPLDSYFVGFAKQIGLNVAQFKTDYASSQVNSSINADLAAFKKTGAEEATPAFFLDGKQIHPGYNITDFQEAIDTELKTKSNS